MNLNDFIKPVEQKAFVDSQEHEKKLAELEKMLENGMLNKLRIWGILNLLDDFKKAKTQFDKYSTKVQVVYKGAVKDLSTNISIWNVGNDEGNQIYFKIDTDKEHPFDVDKLKAVLFEQKLKYIANLKQALEDLRPTDRNIEGFMQQVVQKLIAIDPQNAYNWRVIEHAKYNAWKEYKIRLEKEAAEEAEHRRLADKWRKDAEKKFRSEYDAYCYELLAVKSYNDGLINEVQERLDSETFYWARMLYAIAIPDQLEPFTEIAIVVSRRNDPIDPTRYLDVFEHNKPAIKRRFSTVVWVQELKQATPDNRTPYRMVRVGEYKLFVSPYGNEPYVELKSLPVQPEIPYPPPGYGPGIEANKIMAEIETKYGIDF